MRLRCKFVVVTLPHLFFWTRECHSHFLIFIWVKVWVMSWNLTELWWKISQGHWQQTSSNWKGTIISSQIQPSGIPDNHLIRSSWTLVNICLLKNKSYEKTFLEITAFTCLQRAAMTKCPLRPQHFYLFCKITDLICRFAHAASNNHNHLPLLIYRCIKFFIVVNCCTKRDAIYVI